MRGLACLICTVALAAALPGSGAAAPPAEPSAHSAKRCAKISGGRHRVRAVKVSCDFAVRWSRAYLRSGKSPRGWTCYRPAGIVVSYCRRSDRSFWAEPA
jgi:hypothetical protein